MRIVVNTAEDIPFEALVDLAEGHLAPADAAALRVRVAANPEANAVLAEIEALLTLMRQDVSQDAPEHVVRRAQRLLRPDMPKNVLPTLFALSFGEVADGLRRLVAGLHFDSFQAPQASGVRQGAAWSSTRQLLYTAESYDIDVRIALVDDRWQISGQVLGPDDDEDLSGTVVLADADFQLTVDVSDLGEFLLPPVLAGSYGLLVRLPAIELAIPTLEVGPSPT